MEELLNGSMEQAAEALARLAAGTRAGVFQKQAAPAWLTSLGDTLNNNPTLSHGLIGGGLGAAAMGANTALNNRGQSPDKKKSVLGSMLAGGLAGGGIGAGVGIAREGMSGIRNAGGGISGTDAVKPGQFTDPATGQKMMVDPKALKDDPELASKVKGLSTPSLQSQVGGGVFGALGAVRDKVPTTAPWVGAAMGVDALLHNPMFGLSRIDAGQASGRIGRQLLRSGLEGDATLPEAMRTSLLSGAKPGGTMPGPAPTPPGAAAGSAGHLPGTYHEMHDLNQAPKNWVQTKVDALRGRFPRLFGRPNPPTLIDIIGGRAGTGGGSRPVMTTHYAPEKEVTVKTKDPATGHEATSKEMHVQPKKTTSLNEEVVARLKSNGHKTNEGLTGRQLYRTFGKTYAGARSLPAALGARAMIYGTPLAAEYVHRGLQEDEANKQTMREIMQRYAKPVPEGK